MLSFPTDYFQEEVRDGFTIEAMMKCAWAAQLEVLEVIKDICKKNNIKYFADWGTLLGAIRHKGFIPWDDDMDIGMLRPDYDRFIEVCMKEGTLPGTYSLNSIYTRDDYDTVFARILNARTVSYSSERLINFHGCPYAVGIDIFPLDTLPASPQEQNEFFDKFNIAFNSACHYPNTPDEILELIPSIESLFNLSFNKECLRYELLVLADKISRTYVQKPYPTVTHLFSPKAKNIICNRSWFDEVEEVPFETTTIAIPKGYHKILTALYGDYMTPVKGGAGHDYPFYKKQYNELVEYFVKLKQQA